MIYIGIILASALALFSVAVIATALVCFFKIFFSKRQKQKEEYPIPPGRAYQAHREQMIEWIKQIRSMPHTDLSITSFDGLTLRGKYYECKKGAPIEILFHGYKGTSERDLCGGVSRCFALGHSALMVDHRASGNSEGRVNVMTIGWVTIVSDDPAMYLLGIDDPAYTLELIREHKEFVIAFPGKAMAEASLYFGTVHQLCSVCCGSYPFRYSGG